MSVGGIDERQDGLADIANGWATLAGCHEDKTQSFDRQTEAFDAQFKKLMEADAQQSARRDQLLKLADKHETAIASLEKQWQAYLSAIHPRQ